MSRVLIVTAVDVEAHGLARHLGLARRRGPHGLRYRGATLDVVCAGPRARRLESLVALARSASLVISAGTCGALAPHLGEGDLVIPHTVLTLGGHRRVLPTLPGLSQAGALLDVESVVETAASKARLWQDTAALAVDMESATIVEWAATLDLPGIVIRGVSDTATHGIPAALAAIVDGDGRTRVSRAVRVVFRQPHAVPRALALRRGTAVALRSVARALGALGASSAVGQVGNEQIVTRTGGAEEGASSARSVGRFWVKPPPPRQDPSASRPGRS